MNSYIAIVDDDADDQMLLADALKTSNFKYEIEMFDTGEELLSKLTERSEANLPYLIIMDQNMPGKEGSEVVHQLKKSLKFKSIPIILLTGSMLPKYSKDVYFFGASCVLQKPDDFKELQRIAASISLLWEPIPD